MPGLAADKKAKKKEKVMEKYKSESLKGIRKEPSYSQCT